MKCQEYITKSCVYLCFHALIVVAFSYGEEVIGECFIVLTFLSSMIETLNHTESLP